MTDQATVAQEARNKTVGVSVTPSEKDAIDIVVKVRRPEGGVGELLRARSVEDVVEEGRRMLQRLASDVDPEAA